MRVNSATYCSLRLQIETTHRENLLDRVAGGVCSLIDL